VAVADAKPPVHQFMSIANAQSIIESWRVEYNQHRANEAAEEVVHSG